MSEILFDEATHTYTVDGIARRSVTQIIHSAGLIDDTWFTEESRNRGKAVHIASHYLDENDLDLDTVAEAHRPYLEAYIRFKQEARFTPSLIEHRIFHPVYGYCGTLDRTGSFDGGSTVLLDLKTGIEEAWHPCQLAAYAHVFDRPGRFRRMTVHLRKNGTFKVTEYSAAKYADHWNTFLACLQLFNFKMEAKNVRSFGSPYRAA